MEENKIFSVIIPFYNAEETIERTLASLISSKDYIKEIILVNDNSTDNTIEKVNNFKPFFETIKVIPNEGVQGPGPARNTGLKAAVGDWLIFIDADDALTGSALLYVWKDIQELDNPIVICYDTMYFETGRFSKDDIEGHTLSCGGSVYNRKYLVDNNLYFHNILYMGEDEFFNRKIKIFMQSKNEINKFYQIAYPIYMVHHDKEDRGSLSFGSWGDYVCKYHLKILIYLVDFFKKDEDIFNKLEEQMIDNFFFCYFMWQSLDKEEQKKHLEDFKEYCDYLEDKYNCSWVWLSRYFRENENRIKDIHEAAAASCAFNASLKFNDLDYFFTQIGLK